MRPPYSIRRRLIVSTLIAMTLIFGAISFAAHSLAIRESEELFSARLATSARVLEALVARQLENASITNPLVIALPKELEEATDDLPEKYGHHYETKIAFQVYLDTGQLLARSASAPDVPLGTFEAGFSERKVDDDLWQVFALQSGKVWILTAEKDEVRQEMANGIGLSIVLPMLGGGLVLLLAVNLILFYNLRSLRTLASLIAHREPESLAPVNLPVAPAELRPIVTELNSLLARVKAAFDREQRFINAAAHEIRTPIAALQLHVENAQRAGTSEEREKSLADALTAVRRTAKLAEQLLALSRLTAKTEQGQFQPLPLEEVCCEVIAAHEPLLARRGQGIALDVQGESRIWGEPFRLQRLLQNLIDNASQYGAPQGEIEVLVQHADDAVLLKVTNDGPPIPEDELENIFMPYYRVVGHAVSGSGLGLAIVKEIVEQHEATIAMMPKADGQGNVVTVCFKAWKEAAPNA
ncbi:ATP-binding protein [uncultured Oxalicibacterium sp.]|uniref:ATP-binding protein n=1 Tax=uncultured Oxalicibacterium sp. TaxID=1168540 RepID=UPI0025E5A7A1|nr:ATP-binding protein [uncultured Oxalicibacterium sp.]